MSDIHITQRSAENISGLGKAILNNIFDFFGTLNSEGRVVELTGRIFETTNTNPVLLTGQLFSQTVFWQSSENTSKIIEKAIESAVEGEHSRLIVDFRISADEKVALEIFIQRVNDGADDGEIFICGQSVTARQSQVGHSRMASEQLLFAADDADIGLWFWDYEENRIYSTPRCNELFELPAYETIQYETFRAAIHPDDTDFVDEFLRLSRTEGTKYEEEFRVLYSDGTIEWICAEGRSFLDDAGKPRRMIGVVRKITEEKLRGEELAKAHEREKKARQEAVEANRAKDLFINFVSHELRSPLNAILGWSKILLFSKNVDEETRKNALETIERSARVQAKVLNDLVDTVRVLSGRIRLEYRPTNLYEIVRNSFDAQKPVAESKNVSFEFRSDSEAIPLYGDSNRLQQVFSNLLSNAIKFTPEGGKVEVNLETRAESVAVYVTDSGYGIDPEALPNIFNQFSQGNVDEARNSASLGLGLSIVKGLVSRHGGVVHAESGGMGKGSKFTVTLPLSEGKQLNSGELPAIDITNRKLLRGVKIVIVEDDIDSREVLQFFIQQNGAAVTSFDSAKAAIAALTKTDAPSADIIISDLGMPDEDGYSLIRRIRNLQPESGGTIPAMALSAFTSVESRQKAFEAGFDKYCTKPFEPDVLIKDIVEMLKKTSARSGNVDR